ncbi:MAG: radical SAM protein [Candidatus Omnitrophota bacterium]|jgi:MoaA/NifB/PqqE/SkfB family radical SAM enzyme
MPNLKEVIISITNRCNLRCRMCDIPCGEIDELPTSRWKDVIKDACRLGAQTVVFSGGEPLLREDIYELIFFTKENGLSACVTSNGVLIDDRVAGRLYDSGVNVVNVSVEGTKGTHDFLRGEGGFDKAIAALKELKKHKIESTVASTVSKYNYADLPYLLKLAGDNGATTVRLQPFNVIFLRDLRRRKEFLISKAEIAEVKESLRNFIELSQKHKISTNPLNYLYKIPEYLSGKEFFMQQCGALWYSCPINPNGDVFPCWVEAKNRLVGNVGEQSLYGIWLSKKRLKIIKNIMKKGCKGCLMSCYDEAFGEGYSGARVFGKIKKIKRFTDGKKIINKVRQFLKGAVIRFRLRYKFYSSYGGSWQVILKRKLCGMFGKVASGRKRIQDKSADFSSEIACLKKKIEREIHLL